MRKEKRKRDWGGDCSVTKGNHNFGDIMKHFLFFQGWSVRLQDESPSVLFLHLHFFFTLCQQFMDVFISLSLSLLCAMVRAVEWVFLGGAHMLL